ncbi:hypothetical protein GCM10023176_33330 [Micromonospora coerulea]|uniref:Uncharacterized protein n=1 Tax=Micromonospora coerulea TaxID=47856 RepID=A0ABP8SLW5_9ACTN
MSGPNPFGPAPGVSGGGRRAGRLPAYYDSLTLFSPARYSALPGMAFGGGDPDRYPARDEVVAYLHRYAGSVDADIRTGVRVTAVHPARAAATW